jgi:hypothetical protein
MAADFSIHDRIASFLIARGILVIVPDDPESVAYGIFHRTPTHQKCRMPIASAPLGLVLVGIVRRLKYYIES